MRGIFCIILSVPHNTTMGLNNFMPSTCPNNLIFKESWKMVMVMMMIMEDAIRSCHAMARKKVSEKFVCGMGE